VRKATKLTSRLVCNAVSRMIFQWEKLSRSSGWLCLWAPPLCTVLVLPQSCDSIIGNEDERLYCRRQGSTDDKLLTTVGSRIDGRLSASFLALYRVVCMTEVPGRDQRRAIDKFAQQLFHFVVKKGGRQYPTAMKAGN
jgi:hypothetical protein